MDSEANSSLIAPSTTQESFQSASKQSKGQISSIVWAECRTARDNENPDPKLRYCKHCTNDTPYSTSISSNMRKHLKSKHKIDIEVALSRIQATALQQLQQLYLRAEGSGQTNEIDRQVFQKHLNKAIINEAMVSLIVVQNLPFSIVE